ncbi:MAG: hypothetical protein QXK71_05185 [Pyrobaculum sp.]
MESLLLIREFEREFYELVEIIRFERGRRYVYKAFTGDRTYYIHVVVIGDVVYVELWHPNFAVPLLVFRISGQEELASVLVMLKSLVGKFY